MISRIHMVYIPNAGFQFGQLEVILYSDVAFRRLKVLTSSGAETRVLDISCVISGCTEIPTCTVMDAIAKTRVRHHHCLGILQGCFDP